MTEWLVVAVVYLIVFTAFAVLREGDVDAE